MPNYENMQMGNNNDSDSSLRLVDNEFGIPVMRTFGVKRP